MGKETFDLIFVVLVYRNGNDLKDFFASLPRCDGFKKVVIVNAFYDAAGSAEIATIAADNGADFLEVENKGYGFGNNAGIAYAQERYRFDYLVVSNPDIEIRQFHMADLKGAERAVVGPEIVTPTGKRQNPMLFRRSLWALRHLYLGSKFNNRRLFFMGRAANKLGRDFGRLRIWCSGKKLYPIYQTHGSFVIFSAAALARLGKPYDENIFLFAEESCLSYRLREQSIPTFYCGAVRVLHREDGSCRFREDIGVHVRNSNIYVYETYYGFHRER